MADLLDIYGVGGAVTAVVFAIGASINHVVQFIKTKPDPRGYWEHKDADYLKAAYFVVGGSLLWPIGWSLCIGFGVGKLIESHLADKERKRKTLDALERHKDYLYRQIDEEIATRIKNERVGCLKQEEIKPGI